MNIKKNEKGFTLIELLAVIVILGVIMTVAIPNIVSTLDKNKRNTFIKDAKRAITSVEYVIRSTPTYDWPDTQTVVVFPLNKIRNLDLTTSPFDTYYSLKDSFVAITKQNVNDGTADMDYNYYVHLVSCSDSDCANSEQDSILDNRGINVASLSQLDDVGKYELVVRGEEVILDYLRDETLNYTQLLNRFRNTTQNGGFGLTSINKIIVY